MTMREKVAQLLADNQRMPKTVQAERVIAALWPLAMDAAAREVLNPAHIWGSVATINDGHRVTADIDALAVAIRNLQEPQA